MKVCLDSAHCQFGADRGAQGSGLYEQDLTLDIVRRTKVLLQPYMEVVLTRDGDLVSGLTAGYSLMQSLQTRCDIANQAKVDLFVSVHINATPGGTGAEVLIQGAGGDAEVAAKAMLPFLVNAGGWANRGVKVQNTWVLKQTNMPAILTESGFIDNVNDGAKLARSEFRQALALAHAKGICKYFGITYKEETKVVLGVAVLLLTKEDFWAGADVAAKNGNCATFVRPADRSVPVEAMSAKKLIVIGGATTGHSNEVLLSGKTKFNTADAVGKYLG